MANWRKTIVLKDLLGEEDSDEVVREAATAVYERLKQEPEYQEDSEFEAITDEFHELSYSPAGHINPNDRYTLCRWFNDVLNDLYDWADSERIWIE